MEAKQVSINDEIIKMFNHKSKLLHLVDNSIIEAYKRNFLIMKEMQRKGELPVHPDYLGGNELAKSIYHNKYFLKNIEEVRIEEKPEDMFVRLASYVGAQEPDDERRLKWSLKFYDMLYKGYFLPGGRVIAGAGDLYRLKTLANCFVSMIEGDNIESIYKAAYECARTYSYGGGIGVDISNLRPRDAVVHNAADKSTGAVSFMEIYSLTTGLIGQSGRRGALMLTLDVKHPDVMNFINVKKNANWVTKQIVEQCKWSGKFDEGQLAEVEKQVRENTQVRFANISLKVSDEFMQSVDEQTKYGVSKILVYEKKSPNVLFSAPQSETVHYGYGIPSKDISQYNFIGAYDNLSDLSSLGISVSLDKLNDVNERDLFGDLVIRASDKQYAIRYSGDYLLYFGSKQTGDFKRLVKARTVWDTFVAGNYKTAEPGLIFWDTMKRYSPSDYIGKPIGSTNPCGEVPLEDGGACNLASVNLSRMVKNGYSANASVDWELLHSVTMDVTRFLDDVITWNETLNPLSKQRDAAKETRRIGLGYMGIADMLNQLGLGYDSDEGIKLMEKVGQVVANASYEASALLAAEKGATPIWDYEAYSKGAFFNENLWESTKKLVKEHGLRNVAITSIAPTGTISNVILGFEVNGKNYIGISGGIEPIFSLFYTRRSESFGNKLFKVFHSTVQAYIDMKGLREKVDAAGEDLTGILPAYFFRTAHYISPLRRVEIQGIAQRYIDHSISSTVNLPESVEPEMISSIYLDAWKKGLKGITIYRDGSRYPILSVAQEQSDFSKMKANVFKVGEESYLGDEVFTNDLGILTTPFHALKAGTVLEAMSTKGMNVDEGVAASGGACKIKMVNGQFVKECSE